MPDTAPTGTEPLGPVFRALADPTRRAVIERLEEGPASVRTLAQPFDMALPSFTQHLRVLEDAGLIRSVKHGRTRTVRLAPDGIRPAETWLARRREAWERRLDRLDAYAIEAAREEETR